MRSSLRDRSVGSDLDMASNIARELARDLAGASYLARARDRASYLVRARVRVRQLADNLSGYHETASARASHLARDLARAHDRAHDLTSAHIYVGDIARAGGSERAAQRQRRVVPLARRLLVAAARLLPASDRTRYAEEFRSELTEIARAGAGRGPQLAYAVRVVMSARRLHADLRAPRRRRVVP
jgi:hypothetical protein